MVDNISETMSYAIGALKVGILLAFVAGVLKRYSYGYVMIVHAFSTISTWEYLVNPYIDEPKAMLFMAAVPMLAACITLFLMRHEDTYLTFSKS